jgi:hypothetical protein
MSIVVSQGLKAFKPATPMTIPDHLTHLVTMKTTVYDIYTVKTYTVKPTKKDGTVANNGIDDQTYIDHPELVKLVPRGCSDLFADGVLVAQIRGIPKFGGTSVVDDDDDLVEKLDLHYDNVNLDDYKVETRFTEKANGKFAVCTLFKYNHSLMIFGGSKNVHFIAEVGSSIPDVILHQKIVKLFELEFLKYNLEDIYNMIACRTVCAEYVDGKHLIYTDYPYLVYFDDFMNGTFRRPVQIMPTIEGIPSNDVLQKIRKMKSIEGVVLEYVDVESKKIVSRIKHKTNWYVVLRCWREIIRTKNKKHIKVDTLTNQLVKRMNDRSNAFLKLDDDEISYWTKTAGQFVNWLVDSTYEYVDLSPFSDIGMAKIWNDFENRKISVELEPEQIEGSSPSTLSTNSTMSNSSNNSSTRETINRFSRLDLLVTPEDVLIFPKYYNAVVALAKKIPVVVVMAGLPGSGKTSLAKRLQAELKAALPDEKNPCEIFSIENYFMVNGRYYYNSVDSKKYKNENIRCFQASTARVRILDDCFEHKSYYSGATATEIRKGCACIVLATKIPDDIGVLAKRNIHKITLAHIQSRVSKYKPAYPNYIGCFPAREDVVAIAADINILQNQPLHVTFRFIGDKPDLYAMYGDCFPYGEEIDIEVTGYSINPAGTCLVAECKSMGENRGNHITLCTNVGFHAKDVGTNMSDDNIILYDKPIIIKGVVVPFY